MKAAMHTEAVCAYVNGKLLRVNGMPRIWKSVKSAKKSKYCSPWQTGDTVVFCSVFISAAPKEVWKPKLRRQA